MKREYRQISILVDVIKLAYRISINPRQLERWQPAGLSHIFNIYGGKSYEIH